MFLYEKNRAHTNERSKKVRAINDAHKYEERIKENKNKKRHQKLRAKVDQDLG